MSGAETKGTQVGIDLPNAHQGYPVVTTGASRNGSGGVRSNIDDEGEKEARGQGERVMRP